MSGGQVLIGRTIWLVATNWFSKPAYPRSLALGALGIESKIDVRGILLCITRFDFLVLSQRNSLFCAKALKSVVDRNLTPTPWLVF